MRSSSPAGSKHKCHLGGRNSTVLRFLAKTSIAIQSHQAIGVVRSHVTKQFQYSVIKVFTFLSASFRSEIDTGRMAPSQPIRDPTQAALVGAGTPIGRQHHLVPSSSSWLFSREDIEKLSPSRVDRIHLKEEEKLRRSYCQFIRDLGMQLKVPQIIIATATVSCHRFFLRQSHSNNDRYTVATSCMFLAGKSEDTPMHATLISRKSYEIRHGAVSDAVWKNVGKEQKKLVFVGELLVLNTLGFDLVLDLPYKPLVAVLKSFNKGSNIAQAAWNFVNDSLQTTLLLQFKADHIAIGAIFVAAKLLKIELSTDGKKVCWQELGITPLQLEDISTQLLELYKRS